MRAEILIVLALSLGFPSGQKRRTTRKQSEPPIIVSFNSSSNSISFCRFNSSVCAVNDGRLTLTTTAQDLQSEALIFSYKVTAGKIEGEGSQVIWDLNDAANGQYTATVSVKNKSGVSANATLTVTIADCGSCDPPPPPCPTVTVECPSEVTKSKLIEFIATVKGGDPNMTPSYRWWTSSGKIIRGENEKRLTVELTGFPFETVTATVSIGGADPSCIAEASCTTTIKK